MLKLVTLVLISSNELVQGEGFGYDSNDGPSIWPDLFETCKGDRQSPINIELQNIKTKIFSPLKFFGFSFPAMEMSLENTGKSISAKISDETCIPTISGGPLKNATYQFEQLLFHWGRNDSEGSEHTIDGKDFPLEMQLIFFNTAYGTFGEAVQYGDGLAIMAVFFYVTATDNFNFASIFKAASSLPVQKTVKVNPVPSLVSLLPRNHQSYFSYSGGLTTPPCSEIVTWLVLKYPIGIGEKQLNILRNVDADSKGNKMTHNYRPPQPLAGREVSFVQRFLASNIDFLQDLICRLSFLSG